MSTTTLASSVEDTASHSGLTPREWLGRYDADSSLFASSSCSLLTRGQASSLRASNLDNDLADQAYDLLARARRSQTRPVVLGAIPFDTHCNAHLFVPETVCSTGPLRHAAGTAAQPASGYPEAQILAEPEAESFEGMVEEALSMLKGGPLRKIVLARTLNVSLHQVIERRTLVERLLHLNPYGFNFAINLESTGEDPATFFGASPELLIERQDNQVTATPLAGTAARHPDRATDAAIGKALQQSTKNRREHAIVVDNVLATLRPFCDRLHAPKKPGLTQTDGLWHLGTAIRGQLRAPYASVLELALALHPTPAVCGQPARPARAAIDDLEPFERGLFAGAVGYCDTGGNGQWAVAIRCGQYQCRQMRLYAGAGIVHGSVPADERIETGNKLTTMLHALGIDGNQIERGIIQ